MTQIIIFLILCNNKTTDMYAKFHEKRWEIMRKIIAKH